MERGFGGIEVEVEVEEALEAVVGFEEEGVREEGLQVEGGLDISSRNFWSSWSASSSRVCGGADEGVGGLCSGS